MWQTAVVLLIVAGVLIYIVRHYAAVIRGETSTCSGCSGSCRSTGVNAKDPVCNCGPLQQGPHSGTVEPAKDSECDCASCRQPFLTVSGVSGNQGGFMDHCGNSPEKDRESREN
ncbi:MAG: hypothetical protein ABFD97_12710 [Syntrophobacter sp.]